MTFQPPSLAELYRHSFDDVVDVRSPAEFAEDHVPGAINLPVLDNDERAEVGTIYKQDSRFRARRVGAALAVRNVAGYLEGPLADRPGSWRPLVYCWRGGQRSGTFSWLMREIGWRAEVLQGGYRTYRRMVATMLHDTALPYRFVVLAGMTCTGKTAWLQDLAHNGMQVLDLEGLAMHRGSVFGGRDVPQPTQKAFETRVAQALCAMDRGHPVVVEAESSKVGGLLVPPSLWSAMRTAPRVAVAAPLEARARFAVSAYADLTDEPARLQATLADLIPLQGRAQVEAWQAMVAEGALVNLASDLMQTHYDPRYARSMAQHGASPVATLQVPDLRDATRAAIAPRLADLVRQVDDAAQTCPAKASLGA